MATQINWSGLSLDLLCIVFSNLPLRKCWQCKTVCTSWRSAVDEYLSSTAQLNCPPLLMLPLRKRDPDNSVLVFCPEDPENSKHRKVIGSRTMHENFSASKIIGCSFGWLIMMDTNLSSYLINPYTLDRIELPSLKTCPRKGGEDLVIAGAILSSNPSLKKNNFAVIAILGFSRDNLQQLGFLNFGDSEWSWPGETGETGNDFRGHMLFHINRLFIICENKDVVEIWEMSRSTELIRKVQIKLESSDPFFYKHSYISHMFEFRLEVFVIRRNWCDYDKIDIYLLDQETLTWNIPAEYLLEEMALFIDGIRVIAVSETRVEERFKEGAIVHDVRNKYECRGSLDPESRDIILTLPKNDLRKTALDSPFWIVPNLMKLDS